MASTPVLQERSSVVLRFAGDSGDGMQIAGERFTDTSALLGNDLATFPDFPAEIRAPAGTIPGVSAFQVHLGSRKILTPGDAPDALVAMNPAALKVHLPELVDGGLLVVNKADFDPEHLAMAGYTSNPLDDEALRRRYEVIELDISALTLESLKDSPLRLKDRLRCKNFLALGFMYWVYSRDLQPTFDFIETKWRKKLPDVADANTKVLKAGYYIGETLETSRHRYTVAKAASDPGRYRKISGNEAMALGLIVAAERAERPLLYAGYPITPASSILEALASYKHAGVTTLQAEDEIAAIGMALGASFAGHLGATATSGPGMCLKAEFIGLAVSTELPLVICNVQRGGPSTGLPTKTEQADLMQALHGRHGEGPLPVIAASSPSDCFATAFEATRIALKYSTPVIILTDLSIANGAEPWRLPDPATLPSIAVPFAPEGEPYLTFKRNPETLARTQAIPGQVGLEHRLGGLEKDESGAVSYEAENHENMSLLRAAKIARIAEELPPLHVNGDRTGRLLVVGWGGTYGAITSAVNALRLEGYSVSSVHLHHINPLPRDLGELLGGFDQVVVPELNLGQLNQVLRARYLVDAKSYTKLKGRPFRVSDLREHFLTFLHA